MRPEAQLGTAVWNPVDCMWNALVHPILERTASTCGLGVRELNRASRQGSISCAVRYAHEGKMLPETAVAVDWLLSATRWRTSLGCFIKEPCDRVALGLPPNGGFL